MPQNSTKSPAGFTPDPPAVQYPEGFTPDASFDSGEAKVTPGSPSFDSGEAKVTPGSLGSHTLMGDLKGIGNFGSDVLQGLGESGLNLITGSDKWARQHLPAFITNSKMGFGKPADLSDTGFIHQVVTPDNTTQGVTKTLGNVAQFFIPGTAEERATKLLGRGVDLIPQVERIPTISRMARGGARVASRIIPSMASTAGVNELQGGDLKTGLEMGLGGGLLGEAGRAIATPLAEGALGVKGIDRTYGRTPGRAILDETRGIFPEDIAKSAQDKIAPLTAQRNALLNKNWFNSVPLKPAQDVVGNKITAHLVNGAVNSAQDLTPLNEFMTTNPVTTNMQMVGGKPTVGPNIHVAGAPRGVFTDPLDAVAIKHGLDADFISRWNPLTDRPGVDAVARNVYGTLNRSLHETVPEAANLDERVSNLIPVAKRAGAADLRDSILQRSFGRMGRPTGALIGGLAGAGLGYSSGGNAQSALEGGLTGLVLPELLSHPATMMSGARLMNKAPQLSKAGVAALLQMIHPSEENQ